jgi:transcriptional regulator with XRE-family HTH domain
MQSDQGISAQPTQSQSMSTSTATIEHMDQREALEIVKEISSRARESKNWGLILGANGKSGRSATGNYSLLAKAIGMTRVHVSRVLKGKVQPSHSTLRRLSEVTGISLDEISEFILAQTTDTEAA